MEVLQSLAASSDCIFRQSSRAAAGHLYAPDRVFGRGRGLCIWVLTIRQSSYSRDGSGRGPVCRASPDTSLAVAYVPPSNPVSDKLSSKSL